MSQDDNPNNSAEHPQDRLPTVTTAVRVVDTPRNSTTANSEEDEGERKPMTRFEFVSVIIFVVTLVIAILTGFIFFGQFREMISQTDIANIAARQTRKDSADNARTVEQQLRIAQQQVNEMKRSADQAAIASRLQTQVARFEHSAVVRLTPWWEFMRQGDMFSIHLALYNKRGTEATSIQIAARMDFRTSVPDDPRDYSFHSFSPTNPQSLPPHEEGTVPTGAPAPENSRIATVVKSQLITMPAPRSKYPLYAHATVYVWGKIRYKDFNGQWVPDYKFCRRIPAQSIVTATEGPWNVASAGEDCPPQD